MVAQAQNQLASLPAVKAPVFFRIREHAVSMEKFLPDEDAAAVAFVIKLVAVRNAALAP